MKPRRWLPAATLAVALAAGAGAGGGCEQDVREANGKPKPADATATRPAPPAATLPADPVLVAAPDPAVATEAEPAEPLPQPVLTFLMIDGLGADFPPTRLLLHGAGGDGGKVRAELFSDLPKSAIKDYDGNELYLEMDLSAASAAAGATGPDRVDGATWRFKSTSSERAESANGIFLNGQRRHLQPEDVLIKFERRGGQLVALVMGQFRAFEPGTPDALAPFAGVRGELTVEVVEER